MSIIVYQYSQIVMLYLDDTNFKLKHSMKWDK